MTDTPTKVFIRSPSYPSMSLRDAVEAIGKIERQYRSSPVGRETAVKLIGFSSSSGPANKALAALASYGLLERAGKGDARVTERARAILHAANDREKKENLLAAASEPELFRALRERFHDIPVPPEDGVITHLNRQGFNPSAVKPAARAFLQTMEYVEELGANDSHGAQQSPMPESPPSSSKVAAYGGAKVGDLIQWEANGVLKLQEPMRVRLVSEDGQWVCIEGSETGIPMDQIIVEERAAPATIAPPRFPLAPEATSGAEFEKQRAGESEWMRNKVGRDTNVRLLVTGEMGPKEIGRLIKLLEAQKAVLIEDEDDDI